MTAKIYRGRIAPSPTGYLHLGHAMTFWRAQERACAAGGKLILRIEDLDLARCREEFREAIIQDLQWFGLEWDEGPFFQSERRELYLDAWEKLREGGFVYPCHCSRKDVAAAGLAPHEQGLTLSRASSGKMTAGKPSLLAEDEPIYPGTCRPTDVVPAAVPGGRNIDPAARDGGSYNWRFRVPDGEEMDYVDLGLGERRAIAGKDFGDFVIWRRDEVPSYQLAVTVDDAAMGVTEVVRGEDLLLSTFRQLLIYRALGLEPPQFFHAPLIRDETGKRLAKRHAAMSLRALRESGVRPEELRGRHL